MENTTSPPAAELTSDYCGPCAKPFLLCQLAEGKKDKLGHMVKEILWVGQNYAIYCSEKGMHVQFSDCRKEEAEQRCRYTEISPETCELRYLIPQMNSGKRFGLHRDRTSLFHHNIAQAMMLVMENKVDEGKQLAEQTLKMAVQRVTNDNTVRYLGSGLLFGLLALAVGGILLYILQPLASEPRSLIVAAMSGATGAMFRWRLVCKHFNCNLAISPT